MFAPSIVEGESDDGTKRWNALRQRVIEHVSCSAWLCRDRGAELIAFLLSAAIEHPGGRSLLHPSHNATTDGTP